MPTLKEIQRMLDKLGTLDTFGTKKEIKYLPEIMNDNEEINYLTTGYMGGNTWLIVCTNTRIIFLDKGMLYGLKQVETLLEKINSISQQQGLLLGAIAIWDGASKTVITNVPKRSVKPFVEAVNKAIANIKKTPESNTQQKGVEDTAAQIEKMASLRDKGILTEEEFQAKKSRLLNLR